MKEIDEGYIKFQPIWQPSEAFPLEQLSELIHWRQACYHQQWIGTYPNGIGFGNISARCRPGSDHFFISGSATGGVALLDQQHFAKVTAVAAQENKLWCKGPILASSESMSHAAIYQVLSEIQAVIHIHDLAYWQAQLHHLPTTAADAPYGSPEMVDSILHLLGHSDLPQRKIFVMEGHQEGVFAFGRSLAEAFDILKQNAP